MRKQIVNVAVLTCVALGVSNFAAAQAKQGDKEVKAGGSLFSLISDINNQTNATFDFGLGYFVKDRFEVTLAPRVTVSASSQPTLNSRGILTGGSTNYDTDAGLAFQGQFFLGAQASKVKPYLGGTAIIQSFKTRGGTFSDNLYTGGIVGLKNYFTERAALDMNGQYGFRASSPGDFQLLTFTVGITYLF